MAASLSSFGVATDAVIGRPASHPSYSAVSLEWLASDFMPRHPEVSEQRMTAGEVVGTIVVPATRANEVAYTEYMQGSSEVAYSTCETPLSLGRAFFIVAHSWSSPFADTVRALVDHFSVEKQGLWRPGKAALTQSKIFLWIDVFAMNQHTDSASESSRRVHREVVENATQTLMVLDTPSASVLSAMWPLYESWHSARKGRDALLLVAWGFNLKPMQQEILDLDLSFVRTDSQEALALVVKDVEKESPLYAATAGVKAALVDGALRTAAGVFKRAGTPEVWAVLNQTGFLCTTLGFFNEAASMYSRVLKGREAALGPDHPDTVVSVCDVALVMQAQGRLHEAEPLLRRAVQSGDMVLGSDHPETCSSVYYIAGVLAAQGKMRSAELLSRQALKGRERALGMSQRDTILSVLQLAGILRVQRDSKQATDEAEALYRRTLDARTKTLGQDAHETLEALDALARHLQAQRKLEAAEELLRDSLAVRQLTRTDRPDMLSNAYHLAHCLQGQGNAAGAEPLFLRAYTGRTEVLGPDHDDSVASLKALKKVFQDLGKVEEADKAQARLAVIEDRRSRVNGGTCGAG